MKETLFVSFSGGRTSAYMCWWLLNNKSAEYDFIFVFANTGQEAEETLIFLDMCDKAFGLNLVWLEAVINPERGKGTSHKVVSYETATRDASIFDDMCAVYGIPNTSYPHCNRELKLAPIQSYKKSLGYSRKHLTAIGIRSDEIDRMNVSAADEGLTYPLIKWSMTTKAEIIHWWGLQSFDLEIPEHKGNCNTCWKKSDRKLYTLAQEDISLFEPFASLEGKYGSVNAPDRDRVFWRKNRSTAQLLSDASKPFKTFVDHKPELQLRLITDNAFEVKDIDIEGDCGGSCEI